MILRRVGEFFQRIDWSARLKAFGEAVGALVGGAILFGGTVIVLNFIHDRITGNPANWMPIALLAATFGAAIGVTGWLKRYVASSARDEESRLVSYLRVAVPAVLEPLVLALFLLLLGVLTVPIPHDRELVVLLVLGAGFAFGLGNSFLAICNHAYKRHEFLTLVVTGFVIQGACAGAGFLILCLFGWLEWQGMPVFAWNSMPQVIIIGALLGVAFELWRKFARPRGWTATVTIGAVIGLLANVASRGKLLVIGLWWIGVGGIVLLITWGYARTEFKPEDATWHWIVVVIGAAVGAYWLFARGLGPAWNAIATPARLTDDDFVHGSADLADEDEAVRAARGGRR